MPVDVMKIKVTRKQNIRLGEFISNFRKHICNFGRKCCIGVKSLAYTV